MRYAKSCGWLLCAALVGGSAESARADGAEAFVGGLLGSAIGTAITNNAQQRQTAPQRTVVQKRYVKHRAPVVVNSYQRDENRRVQTALNYFGFNAGPVDGVMGGASRGAIMQYQATVGFVPTGMLMEHEKIFLTSSYERAVVGGPQAAQVMAASGQGTRGLLLAYRQEQLGVPAAPPVAAAPPAVVPAFAAPVVAVAEPAPVPAAEPEPAPLPAAAPVVIQAAAPAAGAMPSFMPAAPGASLTGLCNRVMMELSGGPIAVSDNTGDAMRILDEQFCVARSHAIDQADSLIAAVQGFTPDEMRQQCEAFAPTMARFTTTLAGRPPAEVGAEVRAFLDGTGAQPAQMSGTARVCLGIGYSTDNAELAVGSALVLAALGEPAYGELVGYQVVTGAGLPSDCACGLDWMQASVDALDAGARPLVGDPAGDRTAMLAAAIGALRTPDPRPTQVSASPADAGGFALPKAP